MSFAGNESLILDFQNNSLTDISNDSNPPANVTLLLYGNPVCTNASRTNIFQFCQSQRVSQASGSSTDSELSCDPCPMDMNYEHNPLSPIHCLCTVPIGVGYRLKSPGISDFRPYVHSFEVFLTSHLDVHLYQLLIDSFAWEEGPRLRMNLKLFPNNSNEFDASEILRIREILSGWKITLPGIFGPYELLNYTLGSSENVIPNTKTSGLSKGALLGIIFGFVAAAATLSVLVTVFIMRRQDSKRRSTSKSLIKIDGVKSFKFRELAMATNNFGDSMKVGHGGYGNVYRGVLADGTLVAIKRAYAGSLQGSKEFYTEIEFLSRLHHRNLVSLLGYCNESDEQMLVYEFMPNGTLRDHLSAKSKESLNFSMRVRIALGSARGILYLHTEADPPIFHRDIKASNILLDSRFTAKVADFGLSRLAPVPDVEGSNANYVSTVVKGTPGYLDPEYFLTRKLTDKSDVYSLGVVFLELLTGMQPITHGKNIVREVSMAYKSGDKLSVIDNRMGSYPSECIEKFATLALKCCEEETNARPSMSEVVRELENIWHLMPEANDALSESTVTDSVSTSTFPSSTSATTCLFVSSDVSGDVISNVTPR